MPGAERRNLMGGRQKMPPKKITPIFFRCISQPLLLSRETIESSSLMSLQSLRSCGGHHGAISAPLERPHCELASLDSFMCNDGQGLDSEAQAFVHDVFAHPRGYFLKQASNHTSISNWFLPQDMLFFISVPLWFWIIVGNKDYLAELGKMDTMPNTRLLSRHKDAFTFPTNYWSVWEINNELLWFGR